MHACYSKFSKELKHGTEFYSRPSDFQVMDQNSQNNVLIKYSRTAWPTFKMLIPFLSSLDNLL